MMKKNYYYFQLHIALIQSDPLDQKIKDFQNKIDGFKDKNQES